MKPHKRILSAILIFVFSATSISCNVPINFNQSYNLAPNTQLTSPRLQTNFANIISGKRINPHVAAVLSAVLIGISGYPIVAVTVALLWFGGYLLYQLTDRPSEHRAVEPEYDAMIYYLRHKTKEDALKFIQTVEPHIRRAYAKGKRIVVVSEQGGLPYTADFDQLLRTNYAKARNEFEREKKRIHELLNSLLKDPTMPIPDGISENEFLSTIFASLQRLRSEGIPIHLELEDPELNEWVYETTEREELGNHAIISFFQGMTTDAIKEVRDWFLVLRLNSQARDKQFIQQLQGLLREEGVFVVTFRGMAHNMPMEELLLPGLAIYANRDEALSWLQEEVLPARFGVSEYNSKKLLGIPMTQEEENLLLLSFTPETILRYLLQQEGVAPTDISSNMLLKKILHPTNMSYNDLLELSSHLALNPQLLRNPSSPHDQPIAIYSWMRAKGKISHEQARQYFPAAERMRQQPSYPYGYGHGGSTITLPLIFLTLGFGATPAVTPVSITADREISRSL